MQDLVQCNVQHNKINQITELMQSFALI